MMMKLIIGALFLVVLYCLGSAAYLMMKDSAHPERMAKALTWRISVSLLLFVLLIVGYYTGWIMPHGLPVKP